MNYADKLQLQINYAYTKLEKAGWHDAAASVDASARSAGTDVTALMAAADHAAHHLNKLEAWKGQWQG